MKVTHPATRPQCDRVAYYVSPDDRRVTIPIAVGMTPAPTIERYGRTYVHLLVGTPEGEDANAVIDRAILQAVREADAAGELEALLAEDAA
jgi:hypothetical protein